MDLHEQGMSSRTFVIAAIVDLLDQVAACLSISRSEYLRKLLLEKQINQCITDLFLIEKRDTETGR